LSCLSSSDPVGQNRPGDSSALPPSGSLSAMNLQAVAAAVDGNQPVTVSTSAEDNRYGRRAAAQFLTVPDG